MCMCIMVIILEVGRSTMCVYMSVYMGVTVICSIVRSNPKSLCMYVRVVTYIRMQRGCGGQRVVVADLW